MAVMVVWIVTNRALTLPAQYNTISLSIKLLHLEAVFLSYKKVRPLPLIIIFTFFTTLDIDLLFSVMVISYVFLSEL